MLIVYQLPIFLLLLFTDVDPVFHLFTLCMYTLKSYNNVEKLLKYISLFFNVFNFLSDSSSLIITTYIFYIYIGTLDSRLSHSSYSFTLVNTVCYYCRVHSTLTLYWCLKKKTGSKIRRLPLFSPLLFLFYY